MLKPTETLQECDPRFVGMERHDPSSGYRRSMGIEDLRSLVEHVTLDEAVPKDVREQFDIARNAFVYSWFVYDFATLAEKQGFAVLEMALRRRANPDEASNPSKGAGLAKLLKKAKQNGWLRTDNFVMPSVSGLGGTMSRLDLLLEFRNHAMHGNVHLLPQETPTVLALCAEVINALFLPVAGASAQPYDPK
jgi:hypothetical protein